MRSFKRLLKSRKGAIEQMMWEPILHIILVLVIAGVILFYIAMVTNDNSFERSFYAIDTALLMETLHASPGSVLFDYGEEGVQDYSFEFSKTRVEVFNRDSNGRKPPAYLNQWFNIVADNTVIFEPTEIDQQPLVFYNADKEGVNLDPALYAEKFLSQTTCSNKNFKKTGKVVFDYVELDPADDPTITTEIRTVEGSKIPIGAEDLNKIMHQFMSRLNDSKEDYFAMKDLHNNIRDINNLPEYFKDYDLLITFQFAKESKIYYTLGENGKYARFACLFEKELFTHLKAPKKDVDSMLVTFNRNNFMYSGEEFEKEELLRELTDNTGKILAALDVFFNTGEAGSSGDADVGENGGGKARDEPGNANGGSDNFDNSDSNGGEQT